MPQIGRIRAVNTKDRLEIVWMDSGTNWLAQKHLCICVGLLPVCMAQLLKSVASRSILQPWRAACFHGIWKIRAVCRIKYNKVSLNRLHWCQEYFMIHALFCVRFPKRFDLHPGVYICVCVGWGCDCGVYLVQPADSWIPPRLNLLLQPRPQPQPACWLHAAVQASGEWKGVQCRCVTGLHREFQQ